MGLQKRIVEKTGCLGNPVSKKGKSENSGNFGNSI